jgi:hypothetical protein
MLAEVISLILVGIALLGSDLDVGSDLGLEGDFIPAALRSCA